MLSCLIQSFLPVVRQTYAKSRARTFVNVAVARGQLVVGLVQLFSTGAGYYLVHPSSCEANATRHVSQTDHQHFFTKLELVLTFLKRVGTGLSSTTSKAESPNKIGWQFQVRYQCNVEQK